MRRRHITACYEIDVRVAVHQHPAMRDSAHEFLYGGRVLCLYSSAELSRPNDRRLPVARAARRGFFGRRLSTLAAVWDALAGCV